MAVINLTEARIRDLEPGSGIWRDEQVKGLMVVCHATTKTYAVQGDVRRNGRHVRTVRVKIDRVDRIGLREARNRAKAIMSQIQSGIDPTAKAAESGITISQALDAHLGEKPFRAATEESYRYNVDHYLARYRNRAVTDLGGSGIDAFVDWSTADPDYDNHGEVIRRRWNSLDMKRGAITARTLIAALPKEMRREATELLSRAAAEDDFPDDTEADEKPVDVWSEWVFVADAMQFIRRKDGRKYRTDQWKALYGGLYPEGEILNAVWKARIPVKKFERLIYLPGKPEIPYGGGTVFYNIWRKSGVEATFGDVKPFLDHMAFLFPNEGDRELVLDYLALLVKKPADKIHFALLLRGAQGTGKSWIGNLMERIIGKPNVVRPSNDEVVSRWTHWMEGAQLAIVEELMTLGRLEVANRLKPVITDTTIRIEEKNCSIYSIPNHLNFICFTNHEDALKIEHGDRRWLVVFSPAVKKEAAYYDRLFGYLEGGGAAFVKHFLSQRQIALNGQGVAPATSGKETMRRMSMGDAES